MLHLVTSARSVLIENTSIQGQIIYKGMCSLLASTLFCVTDLTADRGTIGTYAFTTSIKIKMTRNYAMCSLNALRVVVEVDEDERADTGLSSQTKQAAFH
jgi:hypothetical protein